MSAGNDTKVEIYSGCSFEGPHVHKGLAKLGASKDGGVSLPDESKRIPTLKSFHLRSGIINNKSIFSIGDHYIQRRKAMKILIHNYLVNVLVNLVTIHFISPL